MVLIQKAYTITGDGVDDGAYVLVGEKFTLPAKGSFGGTGMKVTGIATPGYVAYGAEITPTGNVTLAANYVEVTISGSVGGNAAFSVTPNGESAVTAAGKTLVKVGDTIAIASTAAHADNFKVTVTDAAGKVLLPETTLNGNGGGDRSATTAAAENADITINLATP